MKTANVKVTIRSNDFDQTTQEEMWSIYQNFYSCSYKSFMSRIARNNYFAMYTANAKLVGFTSLRVDHQILEDKKHLFFYFEQTVIDQAYRGESLIQQTGLKLIVRFAGKLLTSKAYFWADALTYQTYLGFTKSLTEYYPSRKSGTPPPAKQMLNYLGDKHFGNTYSAVTGIIYQATEYGNAPSERISSEQLADPDIRFYVGSNPFYIRGNGLLVMAPLTKKNLKQLLTSFLRSMYHLPLLKHSKRGLPPYHNQLGIRALSNL
jgi:hypothetical protein